MAEIIIKHYDGEKDPQIIKIEFIATDKDWDNINKIITSKQIIEQTLKNKFTEESYKKFMDYFKEIEGIQEDEIVDKSFSYTITDWVAPHKDKFLSYINYFEAFVLINNINDDTISDKTVLPPLSLYFPTFRNPVVTDNIMAIPNKKLGDIWNRYKATCVTKNQTSCSLLEYALFYLGLKLRECDDNELKFKKIHSNILEIIHK